VGLQAPFDHIVHVYVCGVLEVHMYGWRVFPHKDHLMKVSFVLSISSSTIILIQFSFWVLFHCSYSWFLVSICLKIYLWRNHKIILVVLFKTFHPFVLDWLGFVATLALSSRPKQELARVRVENEVESHFSCPRECKKMWRNESTHSQMGSHFGSWSSNGLPNLQRVI